VLKKLFVMGALYAQKFEHFSSEKLWKLIFTVFLWKKKTTKIEKNG